MRGVVGREREKMKVAELCNGEGGKGGMQVLTIAQFSLYEKLCAAVGGL